MQMKSFSDILMYTTVQIDTETGSGTGFVFVDLISKDRQLAYIVTNKHVIEGDTECTIVFHCKDQGTRAPNGKLVTYNFPKNWPDSVVFHPDPDIDLCAIPIVAAVNELSRQGYFVYSSSMNREVVVSTEELDRMDAIEDVIMIGYPTGLSDEVNNLPLMRRGITATHPNIDFNGTPQGVIDIATFNGSSGSPIFLFNDEKKTSKRGTASLANPPGRLLGVLWGGPTMALDGEIKIREIPTKKEPIAITTVRLHLGYYIKARELLVLADHVLAPYLVSDQQA